MNNLYRTDQYDSNCICFWAPITNIINPDIIPNRYWINDIWDTYSNKFIIPTCNENTKWYKYTHLGTTNGRNTTKKVHRVVMMTFMWFPGCEKYEVNHKNGDHGYNYIMNLEWVTGSLNRIHSINTGLEDTIFGKPIVKLSIEEIHQIRFLREQGLTYPAIINEMNLQDRGANRKLIERIVNGKSKLYSRYY